VNIALNKTYKIVNVGLDGINVSPERLRVLRPKNVDELAGSIKANGLLQPIVLRPRGTAGYWLVAGHHRLEAARKLKWEAIAAIIFDGMDADEAELAEIDENLIRAELSPIERALHVTSRCGSGSAVHRHRRSSTAARPAGTWSPSQGRPRCCCRWPSSTALPSNPSGTPSRATATERRLRFWVR
jgi:hypothetical protein